MRLKFHVWRQSSPGNRGGLATYERNDVNPDMSFLEMLDVLNQELASAGEEPIAFEHDCREGICGACGCVVNGRAHGGQPGSTLCQLHMRHFADGDEIVIEPWRSEAFPLIKDLVVDRSAFDRITRAGGFVSARTGSAPDANAIPIAKATADLAMDYAECIGCGACVASCPNGAAMLFVGAKIAHLGLLPQGQPERAARATAMVAAMEAEAFGACSNFTACAAACPKQIAISAIARMNRDFHRAGITGPGQGSGKRK